MFIDCFLGYINYSEFGFIRLSVRLATRLIQKTCRLKVCTQSFCYVLMHLALYVAYAKHCQFQPGPDHSGVIDPSRAIPQDGRLSDTDIGSFQDLQRRLWAELGDVCRTSIGYDTMLQFLPQEWFGTDPPPRDWTELWQRLGEPTSRNTVCLAVF